MYFQFLNDKDSFRDTWGDSATIILIPNTNFADNKFQMIIKWSFIQISPTFMAY